MGKMEKLKAKMIDFLKQEVYGRGFERVVFGLSGGIDSAVVAYLCKEAFGACAKALLMPSLKGSKENFEDAKMIANLLKIPHEIIPLKPYEKIFSTYEEMEKVRYGNFCARTRMMLLYDMSQKDKSLVVGTSNKTERMLGYGTIYGDLACAINPIGDLFKTDIFEFAHFLKIPEKIILKKPSADLYEGQNDEDELGYSYKQIDSFLKAITRYQQEIDWDQLNCIDLSLICDEIDQKYSVDFIRTVLDKIQKNRFKTHGAKILLLSSW